MVDRLQAPAEHGRNEDYEALPYPSMPFAYTQPARLAALTELFGLTAPDAREARVLELGCASGGNIVPLAARYRRARFLGVDLSQRHIEDGRARIRALALTNIELCQADFSRLEFGSGQFDYVICHGVFSWVPKQAQDAIFRICAEALVPNGVAAVSYNVFPGWHLRNIIRDICLRQARPGDPPHTRVANARKALELIAGSLQETNPYGLLLRDEARGLASRPAAYIMGEFLAAENAPCYFRDFVERSKNFSLTYLCEGDLNASIPEMQDPEIRRRNRALAGPDHLALEQCIDFFTGRTFRRSVLVKSEASCHIRRSRNFDSLRSLHFASTAGSPTEISDRLPHAMPTKRSGIDQILQALIRAYPETLTYEQLLSTLKNKVPKAIEKAIGQGLFALIVSGQATASSLAFSAGRANAVRPRVWPVARAEAAARQPWVTSLNHSPVSLQRLPIALVPHLDGSKGRNFLRPLIVRALMDGSIEAGTDLSRRTPAELEAAADHYLARALLQLESQALLEAE
jgi:SAM-dependent methyltransferase